MAWLRSGVSALGCNILFLYDVVEFLFYSLLILRDVVLFLFNYVVFL